MNANLLTRLPRTFALLGAACCASLTVAQQLPPPAFYPGDGSLLPTNVTIASVVQDASVYYTTNGTFPTTNGILYTGSLNLTNTTTLWAKAFKAGWTDSSDVMATFYYRPTLVTVQKLVVNDDSLRPSVNIAIAPVAAIKCYAVEEVVPQPLLVTNVNLGGVWDSSNRVIRWGPFADNQARSLTYQVTGNDGIYELSSRISLNGYSTWAEDITTKATLTMTNPVYQIALPVISPAATSTVPLSVSITCSTTNALVYYTLDGTLPTASSALYVSPVAISNALTVRARAYRTNWIPSEVAWMSYEAAIPPAVMRMVTNSASAAPVVSIAVNPTNVAASFAVEEMLPPFMLPTNISHSGVWLATNRVIRWGPFQDRTARTLSYQITGPDGTNDLVGFVSYDGRSYPIAGTGQAVVVNPVLPQLPAPGFVSTNGFTTPTRVTITNAVAGVELRYTLDGSLPLASSLLYSSPLLFSNTTTLRARAFGTNWLPSEPTSADYLEPILSSLVTRQVDYNSATDWQETRLVAVPAAGVKSYAVEEQLPAAVVPILVSHGGVWNPTNHTVRWGPFQDAVVRTLTNRVAGEAGTNQVTGLASFDGRDQKISGTETLVLNRLATQPAATPVISPAGSVTLPVNVSLSCATAGADMYYTTDSTVPTTNSPHYTGSFQIAQPASLRVRAFATGWQPSDVASADFTATNAPSGTATRSITDNATRLPGGSIAATPVGSVRSWAVEEYLPPTVMPTNISHGGVWESNALAIRWGPFQDHTARVLTYTLIGPDGDYNMSGMASFDGQSYSIGGSTLLQSTGAVAFVATPVISPANGNTAPVSVAISCGTSGAAIYYTTNATVPTTNSIRYTGAFGVADPLTVRARAFKDGMLDSDTASATYVAPGDTSTVVRSISGAPSTLQSVSLSASPSGVTLSYAVLENIPVALTPTNISNGGVWHADTHTIQWGPYQDHQPRNLSYEVRGTEGSHELVGVSSFNGRTQPVTGDTTVAINFPAPSALSAVAGNGMVYLFWPKVNGASRYNVHFWPAGGQDNIQVRNAGVPGNFYTVSGLTNNTLYYFTVAACDSAGHESGLSPLVSCLPAPGLGTLGDVWFDQSGYYLTNTAVITVEDPDLNTSSNTVQAVTVRVTSDSDAWGITLALQETGTNSSRFTSAAAGRNLGFTTGSSDDVLKRIHVLSLDKLHAAYSDLQPVAVVTNDAAFGYIPETFPVINGQPVDVAAFVGGTAVFSVSAQGGALKYQWLFGGDPVGAGTNSSLVLTNLGALHEGYYSVVITNTVGAVTSVLARLTVNDSQPYGGIWQPLPGQIQLEMFDEGGQGVAYNYPPGTNYFGGSFRPSETLTFGFASSTGEGILGAAVPGEWVNYSVEVQHTGYYTIALRNAVVDSAGTEHVEIDGTDVTGSLTVPISSSTNVFRFVRKHGVFLTEGRHKLRLVLDTNNVGNVGSIYVVERVQILQQPMSQMVPPGSNAMFSVVASGTGPLAYQWFFKGTNLPWATNSSMTISNLQAIHNGDYLVTCSNAAGSVTSSNATLIVQGPYGGVAQTIPGRIRLDWYDEGGEGVAYHDFDATNWAAVFGFRTNEAVECRDDRLGLGYRTLAYTREGEWLHYSVNVQQTGVYTVFASVANVNTGSVIHVEFDGQNVSGPFLIPNGGSFTNYQIMSRGGVFLPAGNHLVRLVLDADGAAGGPGAINMVAFSLPPEIRRNSIVATGGSMSFDWDAMVGLRYQVQTATNLASGGWSNYGGALAATNSVLRVSAPLGPERERFYRVVLLP